MEVYSAKHDYEKERDDIFSFKEGDKFRITSKADQKWWAAYSVENGEYGYIPSSYMERYIDPEEGKNTQGLSESDAGEKKRQALRELRNKVRPAPATVSNDSSVSAESDSEKNEVLLIKPLTTMVLTPQDTTQVKGKKLRNPVMESKIHMRLHQELKMNHARGGIQALLGKTELEELWQRRRIDVDGNTGSIKPAERNRNSNHSNTVEGELAEQFARRSRIMESENKEESDSEKPEFLKLALRRTHTPNQ